MVPDLDMIAKKHFSNCLMAAVRIKGYESLPDEGYRWQNGIDNALKVARGCDPKALYPERYSTAEEFIGVCSLIQPRYKMSPEYAGRIKLVLPDSNISLSEEDARGLFRGWAMLGASETYDKYRPIAEAFLEHFPFNLRGLVH